VGRRDVDGTVSGPVTSLGRGSTTIGSTAAPTTTAPPVVVVLDQIPPPHPGKPTTIFQAPGKTQQIALTIDDGYCIECAHAYVDFAQRTGIHITFSPNGTYGDL
jgi:peptidoglycan/xylan/chitin deacetylase (PgdA/CDA1 family)